MKKNLFGLSLPTASTLASTLAFALFLQGCNGAGEAPADLGGGSTTTTIVTSSESTTSTAGTPPELTSLSPSKQFKGGTIILKGKYLDNVAGVLVGDGSAVNFLVLSPKAILVIIPDDATTGDIVVYDLDANISILSSAFTLLDSPFVSSSPSSSPKPSSSDSSSPSPSSSSSSSPSPSPSASSSTTLVPAVNGFEFYAGDAGYRQVDLILAYPVGGPSPTYSTNCGTIGFNPGPETFGFNIGVTSTSTNGIPYIPVTLSIMGDTSGISDLSKCTFTFADWGTSIQYSVDIIFHTGAPAGSPPNTPDWWNYLSAPSPSPSPSASASSSSSSSSTSSSSSSSSSSPAPTPTIGGAIWPVQGYFESSCIAGTDNGLADMKKSVSIRGIEETMIYRIYNSQNGSCSGALTAEVTNKMTLKLGDTSMSEQFYPNPFPSDITPYAADMTSNSVRATVFNVGNSSLQSTLQGFLYAAPPALGTEMASNWVDQWTPSLSNTIYSCVFLNSSGNLGVNCSKNGAQMGTGVAGRYTVVDSTDPMTLLTRTTDPRIGGAITEVAGNYGFCKPADPQGFPYDILNGFQISGTSITKTLDVYASTNGTCTDTHEVAIIIQNQMTYGNYSGYFVDSSNYGVFIDHGAYPADLVGTSNTIEVLNNTPGSAGEMVLGMLDSSFDPGTTHTINQPYNVAVDAQLATAGTTKYTTVHKYDDGDFDIMDSHGGDLPYDGSSAEHRLRRVDTSQGAPFIP